MHYKLVEISICTLLVCRNYYFYIIYVDFLISTMKMQKNGNTLFCPPIGHRQERGDYQESWQPMPMQDTHLKTAQEMADKVTKALGGSGIWGV